MKRSLHTGIMALLLLAAALSAALSSCARTDDDVPVGNAVYYWRTTLRLSDSEKDFIRKHDVRTIYTRFFDVVEDNGRLRPESTLLFEDRFPDGVGVVPVVFIDSKALGSDSIASGLAPLILARVDSMMSKHDYALSQEIQIDFDWAASNRQRYFRLLSELADSLHAQGRKLSATIRLHQLSMPSPPVDYGVLMVYNIGNFRDPSETNSILSTRVLSQYVGKLKGYRLPICGALPLYDWSLLFHDNSFVAIVRNIDLNDTTKFRRIDAAHYVARQYMPLPVGTTGGSPDSRIYPGDVIRHESLLPSTLDSVADMLGSQRDDIRRRTVLYHLDEKTISKYNDKEIEKIFGGR